MRITLIAMNTIEFGQRLKAAREAKGASQHDAASAAGMTRPALSQWETGDIKKGVDAEKLWLLCQYLDISVPWALYGNKGQPMVPSERLAESWPRLTARQKEEHLKSIEDDAARNAELLSELKR